MDASNACSMADCPVGVVSAAQTVAERMLVAARSAIRFMDFILSESGARHCWARTIASAAPDASTVPSRPADRGETRPRRPPTVFLSVRMGKRRARNAALPEIEPRRHAKLHEERQYHRRAGPADMDQ